MADPSPGVAGWAASGCGGAHRGPARSSSPSEATGREWGEVAGSLRGAGWKASWMAAGRNGSRGCGSTTRRPRMRRIRVQRPKRSRDRRWPEALTA